MTSTVEAHTHQHQHEDLSYAGQGAVLLDIGGDVGALIVVMPKSMVDVEIEICPVGEGHSDAPRSHVAVLGRPAGGKIIYSAVFPALAEGRYGLYRKSDGPTELIVEVSGSAVSQAVWPTL
jgi:hypothetical protein